MDRLPGTARRDWWRLSRSDRREILRFRAMLVNRAQHPCDGSCCCMCGESVDSHGPTSNHAPLCEVVYRSMS
jgi:hypothetical protein